MPVTKKTKRSVFNQPVPISIFIISVLVSTIIPFLLLLVNRIALRLKRTALSIRSKSPASLRCYEPYHRETSGQGLGGQAIVT
jgi:hypothetical protein